MVRVSYKGGLWRNSEDEVLKAAVMKYGLNQWARISSLLVRKSAAQCKARWFEWLDPNIRKLDWSVAEDERLLHLVKIFPSQWKTIAPQINRTANQCLERYEQLMDEAAKRESQPLNDDSEYRRSQQDTLPESRPARPDSVDLDEDEKEMLSEARARLANTKGKKAKRKERERALEESRRLAERQKARELAAAGIEAKSPRLTGKKRKEVDYNAEIPFERAVPAGFFDTADEDQQVRDQQARAAAQFRATTIQQFEGQSLADRKSSEHKHASKKLELMKEYKLPQLYDTLTPTGVSAMEMIAKRVKLSLPTPTLSESELEMIGKLGVSGSPMEDDISDSQSSQSQSKPLIQPQRTPMLESSIRAESAYQLALRQMQTPLLGGSNPEHQQPMAATPAMVAANIVHRTPAPITPLVQLSTLSLQPPSASGSSRPSYHRAAGSVAATPSRDGFDEEQNHPQSFLPVHRPSKLALPSILSLLPAPKNDYALTMPDLTDDDDRASKALSMTDSDDDREQQERREQQRLESRRHQLLQCESAPVQRNLPRPAKLASRRPQNGSEDAIGAIVRKEFDRLVRYDCSVHPYLAATSDSEPRPLDDIDYQSLEAARMLVAAQLTDPTRSFALQPIDEAREQFYATLTDVERQHELAALQSLYRTQSTECAQHQAWENLECLSPGIAQAEAAKCAQLTVFGDELQRQRIQHECFASMLQREERAAGERVARAESELQQLRASELHLQAEYQQRMIHRLTAAKPTTALAPNVP